MSERKLPARSRPKRLHPANRSLHPRPYYKATADQKLVRLDLTDNQVAHAASTIGALSAEIRGKRGLELADILSHLAERLRCAE